MTVPSSAGTRFVLSAVVGAGVSRVVYRVLSTRLPAPIAAAAGTGDGSEWTRANASTGEPGGDAARRGQGQHRLFPGQPQARENRRQEIGEGGRSVSRRSRQLGWDP